MCKYCMNIMNKEKYWPLTLGMKNIDFGVLGNAMMYLGISRDIETEDFLLSAEIDFNGVKDCCEDYFINTVLMDSKIKYCPFCGQRLDLEEER